MKVTLKNIGKRYNREWIFRGLDFEFSDNSRCAILGGNGSGKSTLLQIISGYLSSSEGEISWIIDNKTIQPDSIFRSVSMCTPLLTNYDDFTLRENVVFFNKFKSFRSNLSVDDFIQIVDLEKQASKQLKFFSSGMRQRVKLGMAILADTPLLLLDEPTSHLDSRATAWYNHLLEEHCSNRSIFIASNSQQQEIALCTKQIEMEQFKLSVP